MDLRMTAGDPKLDRPAFAGVGALTVLAWYALPDAVRSRAARVIIKTGLLAVTGAGLAVLPTVYPEVEKLGLRLPDDQDLGWWGIFAASVAATVAGEKIVFAHGEHRRARGVRFAHTPLAVLLAAVTGAAALVDWQRVTGRSSPSS